MYKVRRVKSRGLGLATNTKIALDIHHQEARLVPFPLVVQGLLDSFAILPDFPRPHTF